MALVDLDTVRYDVCKNEMEDDDDRKKNSKKLPTKFLVVACVVTIILALFTLYYSINQEHMTKLYPVYVKTYSVYQNPYDDYEATYEASIVESDSQYESASSSSS